MPEMRNAYAAPRFRCGKRVEADKGICELVPFEQRSPRNKFRVSHAECQADLTEGKPSVNCQSTIDSL